ERKIMQLEIEREAIKRENADTKVQGLNKEIAELQDKRTALRARWQSEKEMIENVQKIKAHIEELKHEATNYEKQGDYGKVAEIRYGKIKDAETQLEDYEKNLKTAKESGSQLLKEEVDSEDIASVISSW